MEKMTEDQKKFYIDQGIKVGLILFAVHSVKKMLPGSQPGRTDRLTFDLEKTQNRYFYTQTDPPMLYAVPDPWTPNDLANRLHTSMNGVAWFPWNDHERAELYEEINDLGKDRARYLHNYWLSAIDPENTLYRWIKNEFGDYGEYWDAKDKILNNLQRWGIGF